MVLSNKLLIMGLGGALGVMSRFTVSVLVNKQVEAGHIPWGTIGVNILGSFLLCLIFASGRFTWEANHRFLTFMTTGFLGAFTTFSAFSYEAIRLLEIRPSQGLAYSLITVLGGLSFGWLGWWLGSSRLLG